MSREYKEPTVVINGPGGHGKDEFVKGVAQYLNTRGVPTQNVSSIDPVREACMIFGYDPKDKADRDRQLLVEVKDAVVEWDPDALNLATLNRFNVPGRMGFVHIREIDQIKGFIRICAQRSMKVETLHVLRPGHPIPDTVQDKGTLGPEDNPYPYTYMIENDGTVEDLHEQARLWAIGIFGRAYLGLSDQDDISTADRPQ